LSGFSTAKSTSNSKGRNPSGLGTPESLAFITVKLIILQVELSVGLTVQQVNATNHVVCVLKAL
jgi:hypothetical protein